MNIALVYPPAFELNLKGYPLGLAYLSASLKRAHRVSIYDYNGCEFKSSIAAFLDSIRKTKPDLVGVSFNSFNRWGAYKIIQKIKKIDKNIVVVLGGVHASTMHAQVFKYFYDDIDFIIQSEGEQSFFDLCKALESGEDFRDISGLVYKDGEGGFRANEATRVVDNLDDLPSPDFSYCAERIKKNEFAYLMTSRGCPVNCSFCSTSSFWGQNVRMNSPERVAQDVDYVKGLGAKRVFFHDDTFNLGIDRTIKLAELLKKKDIEYGVCCRVRPVSDEMIAKLVESGCRHITWGVESLSDKILKVIDKKIAKEDVKKAFDICAKYSHSLTTGAFFCVGIPGETEETIKESVDYLDNNIKSTHGPGASMLYILPGTKIYRSLVKEGKFDETLWIRSGFVYYYTREHNMDTLNRWRKMINASGIRLPFNYKCFWDYANAASNDTGGSVVTSWFSKIKKKLLRFINMRLGRY